MIPGHSRYFYESHDLRRGRGSVPRAKAWCQLVSPSSLPGSALKHRFTAFGNRALLSARYRFPANSNSSGTAVNNTVVRTLKCGFSSLLLAVMLAGSAAIGAARSDNLVLQGSTTFSTGLAQPFASTVEAQTGHHLEIIPNKSNLGLLALFEHRAAAACLPRSRRGCSARRTSRLPM